MAMGNKLFALAEREFKANRAAPVRSKFRGMNLNIGKYDEGWDKERGTAVRMMGVVLRLNDQQLMERVSAGEQETKMYRDAAAWLQREANYLRKTAGLLDTAASRIGSVLEKHDDERASTPS